jgi:hypothetical protein
MKFLISVSKMGKFPREHVVYPCPTLNVFAFKDADAHTKLKEHILP